jgi:hypothetical protein
MGAMEALNGWLLFGLTTAFLFGVIEKIWLSSSGRPPIASAGAGASCDTSLSADS